MLNLVSGMAANLIENPDFTEGENFPEKWKFETSTPEIFDINYRKNPAVVEVTAMTADMSGYLVQIVPVRPNASYRLKVNMKQEGGKGLLWLTGLDREKRSKSYNVNHYFISCVNNPLVPRFVPKELMDGSDDDGWKEEVVEFQIPAASAGEGEICFLKVNIGCYFSISKISFAHVELVEMESKKN